MIKLNQNTLRNYTVLLSFLFGWIITFVGLFLPPIGAIDNSVIIIFGQAMTYCAVGLGLKDYVDVKTGNKNPE